MRPAEITVDSQSQRQRWLSVLAQADAGALETACAPLAELMSKPWQWLRQPETGLVMVRGRIGGTGAKFNLGEVPVTRCALRLEQINGIGAVGVSWVQGRNAQHAALAARLDALLQDPAICERLHAEVIDPLAAAQAARRDDIARKAAATKVEFYTLAREVQAAA